jgi:hypothetical protein
MSGDRVAVDRRRNGGDERREILSDALDCMRLYHGDVSGSLEAHQVVRWDEVGPVIDAGRFDAAARVLSGRAMWRMTSSAPVSVGR